MRACAWLSGQIGMEMTSGIMNHELDDDETLTAYHEAGHAVIGYALGARIESIQLGGEMSDDLPQRFGECLVNWGPISDTCSWQCQRELMTVLAGPVAEMIYRGEPLHPAHYGPWKNDWLIAWQRSADLIGNGERRTRLLESILRELHLRMARDDCWAAIAAVADQLLAHEYLDTDELAETLRFWIG